MQKYLEGDVSAIISQSQHSNVFDDTGKRQNSAKIKGRKKIGLEGDLCDVDFVKCQNSRLSSVPDHKFTKGNGFRKMRGENITSDDERDVSTSNALKNLSEKTCDTLTAKNENSDDVDKSSFTVFVGNLPLTYDHKKVVKVFSKFGEIESARIRCIPVSNPSIQKKICAITKKFHPSRNNAVAYVVFKSQDSVIKATAHNGMILDGHHLRIDSALSQKRDSKKSVFVGGLPFDVKDDELWDLFKDCGEIEGVRVIRDKNVSMGKGFGYVNFKSNASVELALKLNGREIRNRKINVERCIHKKKRNDSADPLYYGRQRKRENKKSQGMKHRIKSKEKTSSSDFQGRTAKQKSKKKKMSVSKDAARRNRIKSAFLSSSPNNHKEKVKGGKRL